MAEDLYEILGVSRDASDADIKKAYRTLARKYHPDVNKEDGAEERFKKIQKAYGILSDPTKKSQYDQYGVTDDSPGGGSGFEGFGGFGGGFGGGFSAEGFEDIFDTFFGGGGGRRGRKSGPRQGEDLRYDLDITLEEACKGVDQEIEIYHLGQCSQCGGSGAEPGSGGKSNCDQCNGAGQIRSTQRTILGTFSQVTTCPKCQGSGETIKSPCHNCHGKGLEKQKRRINISIPAGVSNGTRLRVSGEGNHGEGGGPAGDLYVFINIKEHAYFERENDDIYMTVEIPVTQLMLGTEISVPTLTGKASLKIPSGTQPGTSFRLRSKGMPHLQGYGSGDQFVEVKAKLPKKLSHKQKELVENLASILGDDVKTEDQMAYAKKRF